MDMLYLGGLFMTKMKYAIVLILLLFLPLINAEITFFDSDDVFIIGSSTTDETSGESTPESEINDGETSGSDCLTTWTCSDWNSCNNGIQIRNCTKEKVYCYADLKKK